MTWNGGSCAQRRDLGRGPGPRGLLDGSTRPGPGCRSRAGKRRPPGRVRPRSGPRRRSPTDLGYRIPRRFLGCCARLRQIWRPRQTAARAQGSASLACPRQRGAAAPGRYLFASNLCNSAGECVPGVQSCLFDDCSPLDCEPAGVPSVAPTACAAFAAAPTGTAHRASCARPVRASRRSARARRARRPNSVRAGIAPMVAAATARAMDRVKPATLPAARARIHR